MTYEDVIRHYGDSVVLAARALKLSRVTLYRWRNRSIPADKQAYIQLLTDGALTADLSADTKPQEVA